MKGNRTSIYLCHINHTKDFDMVLHDKMLGDTLKISTLVPCLFKVLKNPCLPNANHPQITAFLTTGKRVEDSLTPQIIVSPGLLLSMKSTYTIIISIELRNARVNRCL